MEESIKTHLRQIRPDLFVERSQPASNFAQYAHLAVFRDFRRRHVSTQDLLGRLQAMANEVTNVVDQQRWQEEIARAKQASDLQNDQITQLKTQMPEESLLKIDITVSESREALHSRLHMALSAKWSLRTDRAQDCVSQGSKLVALRRGRMPHFAVVTMEPRPAMLKILGDGSGSVDCVYHLDLQALRGAVEDLRKLRKSPDRWSPALTLERLINQGRLRDYDDLVAELLSQPRSLSD